jgi:hypothetical protein
MNIYFTTFKIMDTKTPVYAVLETEHYELYNMNNEWLIGGFNTYDELEIFCDNYHYDLVRVEGLEED